MSRGLAPLRWCTKALIWCGLRALVHLTCCCVGQATRTTRGYLQRPPHIGLITLTGLMLRSQSTHRRMGQGTRANLLRAGVLTQLTADPAVDHPDLKHQLLRCVGAENTWVVGSAQGKLQVGNAFLPLSDGACHVLAGKRPSQMVAHA